ncbi:26S proteasome non-ATPase regulatory subunit 10-like [Sycon ciliatum]|uniref:26S proteasome non-ATPase regulatory subunit 10-like n=1 Tax=Sycon ciliatum TaxID=27933 RepID=UPI0020A8EC8B|eukprot:scpid69068/ scgid13077/ Serine/threonine-protein phosphatase 6 regulatory ankyrin repeat subunit B; Ankyrin repeat domain-containing protein 44
MGSASSLLEEVAKAIRKDDSDRLTSLLQEHRDADLNALEAGSEQRPLHIAIHYKSSGCLDVLLASPGLDVNSRDKDGRTVLLTSAAKGYQAIALRMLDDDRCDWGAVDAKGMTALHHAASTGCLLLIDSLLAKGLDVAVLSTAKRTPLMMAATSGESQAVQLLLSRGASPKCADAVLSTPLHCACLQGSLEIAQQLLDAGAEVDARDKFDCTPLLYALQSKNKELEAALVARGANLTHALDKNFQELCYHTSGK